MSLFVQDIKTIRAGILSAIKTIITEEVHLRMEQILHEFKQCSTEKEYLRQLSLSDNQSLKWGSQEYFTMMWNTRIRPVEEIKPFITPFSFQPNEKNRDQIFWSIIKTTATRQFMELVSFHNIYNEMKKRWSKKHLLFT
mgnify:FL=1